MTTTATDIEPGALSGVTASDRGAAGRRLNTGAGLDRHLRRLFWDAAVVSRRDPRSALLFARVVTRQRKARARRQDWSARGVQVPAMIILSVARHCSLHRAGCFLGAGAPPSAGSVPAKGAPTRVETPAEEMTPAEIREVLAEAVDLGVSVVVLAGGEPLTRPELLDIAGQFPELMFFLVSNGSLLDGTALAKLEVYRNIIPMLSLDGLKTGTDERQAHGAHADVSTIMAEMKKRRLFFGAFITITRSNFPLSTSRLFVRDLVRRGTRFFFYADYVPGRVGTEDLVPTRTQRGAEPLMVDLFRKEFPALFVAASASERVLGGCMAAGRGFAYINYRGDLEPCPFSPHSDANVCESGLRVALESRVLGAIRDSDYDLGEADGGCALLKGRGWVEGLLEPVEDGGSCCPDRLVA